MKYHNTLIWLFLSLFLCQDVSGQMTNSSDDLSFYVEHNDPIKKWPDCVQPDTIIVEHKDEQTILRWDTSLEDKDLIDLEYEYEFYNKEENKISKRFGVVKTKTNNLVFSPTEYRLDDENLWFRVRRVCKDNIQEIVSDWSDVPLANGRDLCPCWYIDQSALTEYTILNDCFFFQAEPPCEAYEESFAIGISIVYMDGETETFFLNNSFSGQFILVENSEIQHVEVSWTPTTNSDATCFWNNAVLNDGILFNGDFDLNGCSTIPTCDDLSVELSSAQNSTDTTKCLFVWQSDNEIQGSINYVNNGVYVNVDIQGNEGFVSVDKGVELNLSYDIFYESDAGTIETISCSSVYDVDCESNSEENNEDTSWMCDDTNTEFIDILDESGNNVGCAFTWEAPSDVMATVQVCNLSSGVCHSVSSSLDTINMAAGFYSIQMSMATQNDSGDWLMIDCDELSFECEVPTPEDCPTNELCSVLNLMQGIALDSNSILLAFQGEFDTYLSQELNALGLTINQAQYLFNCVDKIDLEIKYKNDDFNDWQTVNQLFYTSGNQSLTGISNIDLTTWSFLWENINFSGFYGKMTFTVTDFNGNISTCNQANLNIIEEEEEVEIIDPPIIELPEFTCGEPYEINSTTNTDPLTVANIGELFDVGGFPLLVCDLQMLAPGNFVGEGIVPLPFSSKTAIVDFDVWVNTDYDIFDGTVTVRSDSPDNYPDFLMNPDTLTFGEDICVPTPPPGYDGDGINQATGLDDWGFDENGIHENGTLYNNDGFKADSTFQETGSLYNTCGCSIAGVTEQGEDCDPSCPNSPVVQAFADSVETQIPGTVDSMLEDIFNSMQDSLAALDCDKFRTTMEGLMTELQYSREFIFGENDKYFEKGMSGQFASEPKPLSINMDPELRDPRTKDLEDNHVRLYHCDKSETMVRQLMDILDDLESQEAIDALAEQIQERILQLSPHQVEQFNDPQKFEDWILEQIIDIIGEGGEYDDLFGFDDNRPVDPEIIIRQKLNSIFNFGQGTSSGFNALASIEDKISFSENELEAMTFDFKQGNQYVNGYHRAYILEELARQQALDANGGAGASLLPLQITKQVGSYLYTIYLDAVTFNASGASLDAYCIITDPTTGKKMVFGAENIAFGPTGLNEESRLSLLTNIQLRLNNASRLTLRASEDTYVSWDCEGFSGMGVDMGIEFCRNFVVPLDSVTLQPLPDSILYELDVAFEIPSWLEFHAEINAPPFAMAGYEDIKWELESMILDFSSTQTPDFFPPIGYTSPYYDEANGFSPLWKGFYMKSLTAHLSDQFSSDPDEPITVSVNDLLIDDTGVSGSVGVGNLLNIDDGNLGGWAFSIDSFSIHVLHNHFAGAGLAGEINVPLFEENMDYEAIMYPNNIYEFTVSPLENATMDMVLATAVIYENSAITVQIDNGDVNCAAILNGTLSIDTGSSGEALSLDFPEAQFEGLMITNKAPYFSPGTWGLSADSLNVSMGGFGLSISNIGMYSTPDSIYSGLAFDMAISLSQSISITATGSLGILGRMEVDNKGRQKWVYDHLDPKKFCLYGSFPGVKKMDACIEWYDGHSVYGKGFRGSGYVKFSGFNVEVGAVAQFGNVADANGEDFKYFFVDALANINLGIAVGPFLLDGFGGGVSHHMTSQFDATQIDFTSLTNLVEPPDAIGSTFSGVNYVPDVNTALGLKGMCLFSLAGQKALVNGLLSLEFEFNDGYGLNKIAFRGLAQIMSDLPMGGSDAAEPQDSTAQPQFAAAIAAYCGLEFNFQEPSFHGDLIVFLDAGMIVGAGTNKKLVHAAIHFDPNTWYINIGTPTDRAGVIFNLPGAEGLLEITAYFNMGNSIPDAPEIPKNVRDIATEVKVNESFRKSGAGFMFGAAINLKIQASIAGIASAKLNAGCGFDIMVKDYGDSHCQGSTDQIGINGWYASGQLWAYISGHLSAFGVNIIDMGIAAVLQTRLPNPFWAQGVLAVKIETFFHDFNKQLSFEIGEDCILVGDDAPTGVGLDVIVFIDPIEKTQNIATDYSPNITFALPVGKSIHVPNSAGEVVTFGIGHPQITMTAGGVDIPFDATLNSSKTKMTLTPSYMLPSNDSIHIAVSIEITKDGVVEEVQEKSSYFFTGEAFNYIPESNIVATYPADGMYNVYRREQFTNTTGSDKMSGFIQLAQGQPSLLYDIPDEFDQVIQFSSETGESFNIDYTYEPFENKLSFDLNPDLLVKEKQYKIALVRVEKEGGYPAQEDAEGSVDPLTIYEAYFRVSQYETFLEKMEAIKDLERENHGKPGKPPLYTLIETNGAEVFDQFETSGTEKYKPLVSLEINHNNDWFKNHAEPRLYDILPIEIIASDHFPGEPIDQLCGGGINYINTVNDITLAQAARLDENLLIASSDNFNGTPYSSTDLNNTQILTFAYNLTVRDHYNKGKENLAGCILELTEVCEDENYVDPPDDTGNGQEDIPNQEFNAITLECIKGIIGEKAWNMHLVNSYPSILPGTYTINVKYQIPGGTTSTLSTINYIVD